MRTDADRLIGRAYADLIFQVLDINAKPMRCKEISKEISEHSDFPKLSPQYVRAQMGRMVDKGEVIRIEAPTPYPKRKMIYFALPSVAVMDEDEKEEAFIEGWCHRFAIGEDGKMTKIFDSRGK